MSQSVTGTPSREASSLTLSYCFHLTIWKLGIINDLLDTIINTAYPVLHKTLIPISKLIELVNELSHAFNSLMSAPGFNACSMTELDVLIPNWQGHSIGTYQS